MRIGPATKPPTSRRWQYVTFPMTWREANRKAERDFCDVGWCVEDLQKFGIVPPDRAMRMTQSRAGASACRQGKADGPTIAHNSRRRKARCY